MKELATIYEQMMAVYGEKTGYTMADSADLAVRLYAAAGQLEGLYAYGEWILRQAFPQTASGAYLDMHARLRGVERRQATAAMGKLTFSVDTARQNVVTIPAGTACTTVGLVRYITLEDGVIPAGSLSVTVQAAAEMPGIGGNTAAGTVVYMPAAPAGVASCTNETAFSGGMDTESDAVLRERIQNHYRSLPNGANAAYYRERAMSNQNVAAASVLPRHKGIGTVGVVITSLSGMPDEALIREVAADLAQAREIAVDVEVMAPIEKKVDVTVTVWPLETAEFTAVKETVVAAVTNSFDGRLLGEPVYRTRLGRLLEQTGLVETYEIHLPESNVEADPRQLPVLGTLIVQEGT